MKYTRNEREIQDNRGKPVKIIGITGGIGSGKTVATEHLRALGYTVVDADEVLRALTAEVSPLEARIKDMFPCCVKAGALDRAALRRLIGYDEYARRKLEALTHPLIIACIHEQLAAAPKPVILSAPLLFETALGSLCDATVCIYCAPQTRIARIMRRDGVSREAALQIISAQISDTERATLSDYIVPSDGDIDEFREEIAELIRCVATDKQ